MNETVHRYPRLMTWSVEILCTLIVILGVLNLGITLLHYAWDVLFDIDRALFAQAPLLETVVEWMNGPANRAPVNSFADMLSALIWAAIALFLAILLRNSLPIVRTSSQGILVEFSGDWLPIRWEDLRAVKVTEDLAGERFVLLVQTDKQNLTDWHRFYSLAYNLRLRPGLLVTSSIDKFDDLIRTILSEVDRAARADDDVKPLRLDESASSPLFRLLLSPAAFFTRRAASDVAAETEEDDGIEIESIDDMPSPELISEPIRGHYPARITALFTWTSVVLAVVATLRYLSYWAYVLALEIPLLRQIPPFSWTIADARSVALIESYAAAPVPFFGIPDRPDLPAPWWVLVAAHLMLLFMIGVLIVLRNLLPSLEARPEGLTVRNMLNGRWQLVSWQQIIAVKATELSEHDQILLIQARDRSLPLSRRFSSLLYDGGFRPGILVSSVIHKFQPLMQYALHQIVSSQDEKRRSAVLQQDARSWLFFLAAKPKAAFERLVAESRDQAASQRIQATSLLQAAKPMAWLALLPALILIADRLLLAGSPPGANVAVFALIAWFVSMLEWPLIALISVALDDATGGGEEGYRAVYLYPTSQLPRILAMFGALALLTLNVPVLPIIAWIAAIAWSYFLASALWKALYEWGGSLAVLGGLIPTLWQLLVLLGFLLVQR